jgi:Na+-driven multidrug efflux pump
MREFFSTSFSLLFGSVINTLTYSSGSRVASFAGSIRLNSLSLSTVNVATHQITFQLWWLLSFFSSPLSLAAQSILKKEKRAGNVNKMKLTVNELISINIGIGMLCSVINSIVLFFHPKLFTTDLLVQQSFASIIFQSSLSLFLVCFTTVMDGVFIGTDRMGGYLTACGLSTLSAWIYYIFISIPNEMGTVGTWNGILIFTLVRTAFYTILNFSQR